MQNNSGITPVLDRILVKPDEVKETTDGGIIITKQVAEQHQQSQATGILVAVGPDAYIDARTVIYRLIDGVMRKSEIHEQGANPEFTPKPGDRVVFAKFGGLPVQGADGLEYRLLNDRDITAGADHGVQYTGIESRKPVGVAR